MITVVIPSRGRPARGWAAIDAVLDHAVLKTTRAQLVVDRSDPSLPLYLREPMRPGVTVLILEEGDTGNLVKATNAASMPIAHGERNGIIGNLGDDHMVRTHGWDRHVARALTTPGIAYGDDLLQGERLPTAPFISSAIVRALGWYALPTAHHLFIDNVWRDLGAQADCLRYLPGVVIEHVHPLAGKADWDDGYVKANRQPAVEYDADAYHVWRDGAMASDVETVRRAVL